jgi:hypothetical protein
MLDTNDEITEFNNSGNYDYSQKKKKNIYYEEENLTEDYDNDGPDYVERRTGQHDKYNRHIQNHPRMARHFSLGNSLPMTKSGIGGINHTMLKPIHLRKSKSKKMKLTMNEPKKFKLALDISQPTLNFSMKSVKIPKPELKVDKVKMAKNFEDDYINKMLRRIGVKTQKKKIIKKKKGLFW